MARSSLPAPIAAFIEATNAGDTDAFLAAFTEDAVVSDWGRVYRGRDAIADWDRTDNIGQRSRFDLVECVPTAGADTSVVPLKVSRTEERRGGDAWVSTWRSRGSAVH